MLHLHLYLLLLEDLVPLLHLLLLQEAHEQRVLRGLQELLLRGLRLLQLLRQRGLRQACGLHRDAARQLLADACGRGGRGSAAARELPLHLLLLEHEHGRLRVRPREARRGASRHRPARELPRGRHRARHRRARHRRARHLPLLLLPLLLLLYLITTLHESVSSYRLSHHRLLAKMA